MPDPAERRDLLLERLTRRLHADTRFRGLWLVGSLARDEGDAFSDLDLLAVVDPDVHRVVLEDWAGLVAEVTPVVHSHRLGGGETVVINHVTPGWVRFDVTVTVPSRLGTRPRNLVRPLFDRDELGARLGPDRGPLAPDPATVDRLTQEFLRVLGLLPVALGRADLLVAASGSALLRGLLIELMRQDVAVPDRGGALHLSRLLPAERRDALAGLPPIAATRESAVACHLGCARLFLPLARELGARTGLVWPDAFEASVRAELARVGVVLDDGRDRVGDHERDT